jgi:hypothetical protein
MNFDNRMIGLSAFAKSGKDTVCTLMKRGLMEIDESYRPVKFPFAASLKKKIDPFLSKEIGISAFTQNKGEKDVIRPFLVLFGETARSLDEDYWANNVKEQILGFDQIYNKDGVKLFPVITDVRYENEARMIQSLGGKILHIEREGVDAPNASEEKNDPIVKRMADITLKWPNFENDEEIETAGYDLVKGMLEEMLHG